MPTPLLPNDFMAKIPDHKFLIINDEHSICVLEQFNNKRTKKKW